MSLIFYVCLVLLENKGVEIDALDCFINFIETKIMLATINEM
jgi:hypothetical protein